MSREALNRETLNRQTIRWSTLACALWIAAAWALPAVAADDSHGGGADVLIKTAINLVLLLAVLVYFARKPVLAYFAERRQGISEDLSGAADQLSNAQELFSKWQRKLIDLDAELDEIRATSRHRAEAERDRILADAAASAERIRQNTSAAIAQELRRAREQLRDEATQLAIEMAGQRLEREVTDQDRTRLLDEFIARVEQGDSTSAARGEGR